MEKRKLEEVARLVDDRRVIVHGSQRIMRRGPFKLYIEEGFVPFDDYSFEGAHLVLGEVCDVASNDGGLKVQRADGRFSVTPTHHVVAVNDSNDYDYVARILEAKPVTSCAEISAQTIRLSERNLRGIVLPWPDRRFRRAFCSYLDSIEAELGMLRASIEASYEKGERAYRNVLESGDSNQVRVADVAKTHLGTSLPAEKRKAVGAYRVVSSQGFTGFTDERGFDSPSIVVGQAGSRVLSYYENVPVFPLVDTIILQADMDTLPLLYFALYSKGMRPRLRVVNGLVEAAELPIEDVSQYKIDWGGGPLWEACMKTCAEALDTIEETHKEIERIVRNKRELVQGLLDFDDGVLGFLDAHAGKEGPAEVITPDPEKELVDSSFAALAPFEELVDIAYIDMRRNQSSDEEPISRFDAFWEVLLPIFFRQERNDDEWAALSEAGSDIVYKTWIEDAVQKQEATAFFSGLTREQSCLSEEAFAQIVNLLGQIECKDVTSWVVRGLYRGSLTEETRHEGATIIRRIDSAIPKSVLCLMNGIADCLTSEAAEVFDPNAETGDMIAGRKAGFAQIGRASDLLVAQVAAVMDGCSLEAVKIRVGDALNDEQWPNKRCELVLSVLPPNQGEWTDHQPSDEDPRWVFGTPPRNKANLAWLQHAYSHRAQGGFVLVALCSAVLHESRGCEPSVRRALIESGCVHAVIALPPRLFVDGRAEMSIVVLGDPRAMDAEVCFCDVSGRGRDASDGTRVLLESDVQEVINVINSFIENGTIPSVSGFCRSVCIDQIAKIGDLSPWLFV